VVTYRITIEPGITITVPRAATSGGTRPSTTSRANLLPYPEVDHGWGFVSIGYEGQQADILPGQNP
jgi:hypothetical protein